VERLDKIMIRQKESHIHWNYILALEKDLIEISRFVEFDKKEIK